MQYCILMLFIDLSNSLKKGYDMGVNRLLRIHHEHKDDDHHKESFLSDVKVTLKNLKIINLLKEDIKSQEHRLNYPSLITVYDVLNYETSLECFTSDLANLTHVEYLSRYNIECYNVSSSLVDISKLILDNKIKLYEKSKEVIKEKTDSLINKLKEYSGTQDNDMLSYYDEMNKLKNDIK